MDVEINSASDDDVSGTGEDNSDSSRAGPSNQQELTVELHCEEETRSMNSKWSDSATAGVLITSSTNFDLQCEDEDLELRSSEHTRGTRGRLSKDSNEAISDSFDEEELAPTSEVVLPYCCRKCGETFHDLGTLQEHQQYHSSMAKHSYQCPICSKEFFRTANLRLHRLIHSSDKPYKCPECDKGFIHKVDFWRHLQNVHKVERSKTLKNGSLVTEPSMHGDQHLACQVYLGESCRELPKPYICPTCSKSFRTSNLLSKHKVIHRKDKLHKCQKCKRTFVHLITLKRHLKTHIGERPFYCEVCSRPFTRLPSLHRHQRIHTGEKPYSCPYCDQGFSVLSSLKRHERIHQVKTT
ncbi:zinc finger protein 214-like [Tiliqua scincoides]|uniref:zinc finger protein 214-like n=1 Tax=Tiliqua scincoides TaxID=71010 RepID=UPI0034630BF3